MKIFRPVNILPRCAISKRLRYEKQTKALHLFRLLSLEMLHRRVEIEKQEFRKKSIIPLKLSVMTNPHLYIFIWLSLRIFF
jgi:hypothetical protein